MKLSVVMPCYNEKATIREIVGQVLAQPFDIELLIVDDCSRDGTREILEDLGKQYPQIRVFLQERNQGKGAALRRGFAAATGDVVLVQDADLEYDPGEYSKLLEPILQGKADVVFGSRFGGTTHRVLYFWHSVGNKVLTTLSNMATDLNLTDMETCYKVFRREIIQSLRLEEDRFGIEPEMTAKIDQGQVWPQVLHMLTHVASQELSQHHESLAHTHASQVQPPHLGVGEIAQPGQSFGHEVDSPLSHTPLPHLDKHRPLVLQVVPAGQVPH